MYLNNEYLLLECERGKQANSRGEIRELYKTLEFEILVLAELKIKPKKDVVVRLGLMEFHSGTGKYIANI